MPRPDYTALAPEHTRRLMAFTRGLRDGRIEPGLCELVNIRVSQINGCAFCVDTHTRRAKLAGERDLRLWHLPVWRDSPLFTPRERAALAWAETLTHLPGDGVSDASFEAATGALGETDLADLTYVVMAINAWNRASVAFRLTPGSKDAEQGLDGAGLA